MNVEKAAKVTLEYLDSGIEYSRNTEGTGVCHAAWMLRGIAEGYVQHEKAHRWLGYAQGLLVEAGGLTLAEAKVINKSS